MMIGKDLWIFFLLKEENQENKDTQKTLETRSLIVNRESFKSDIAENSEKSECYTQTEPMERPS